MIADHRCPPPRTVPEQAPEHAGPRPGARSGCATLECCRAASRLVELDGARPALLRLAAGPARALLADLQGNLAALAAANPPAALRERVPWCLPEGDLGIAAYTLSNHASPERIRAG